MSRFLSAQDCRGIRRGFSFAILYCPGPDGLLNDRAPEMRSCVANEAITKRKDATRRGADFEELFSFLCLLHGAQH
eukprot:1961192-Prorocentrum_lima.AAC.1